MLNGLAQSESIHKKKFNLDNGLAIKGYDPVAYFTQNQKKAIKGSKVYTYTYMGATYHFSSTKNLNTFKANPKKYEPQYGGWCAYALISKPQKVDINPKSFKIINGKLYLFYSTRWVNGLEKWNDKKDEKTSINTANKNYSKLE